MVDTMQQRNDNINNKIRLITMTEKSPNKW